MSMIVVPKNPMAEGKPFADLAEDPEKFRRAMRRFVLILEQSFTVDARLHGEAFAKRHKTELEMKRRANILGKWYRSLRNLGYGHIKTMDELPKALRAELDGESYTPPERSRLWVPEGVQ